MPRSGCRSEISPTIAWVSGSLAGPVPPYCEPPGSSSGAHPNGKLRLRSTRLAFVRRPAAWPSGFIDSTSHRSTPVGHRRRRQPVEDRHALVLVAMDHADDEHDDAAWRPTLDGDERPPLDGAAELDHLHGVGDEAGDVRRGGRRRRGRRRRTGRRRTGDRRRAGRRASLRSPVPTPWVTWSSGRPTWPDVESPSPEQAAITATASKQARRTTAGPYRPRRWQVASF